MEAILLASTCGNVISGPNTGSNPEGGRILEKKVLFPRIRIHHFLAKVFDTKKDFGHLISRPRLGRVQTNLYCGASAR